MAILPESQLIDAMARTLFVNAYAQHVEDGEHNDGDGGPCKGCGLFKGHSKGHPQPGPGEDWTDFAPPTPKAARDASLKLAGRIEERNKMGLMALLYQAARADGMEPYGVSFEFPEGYIEEFGHCLAMQSLGHGVSWFDDHAEFELDLPDFEFAF